jgi:hypothetical protein
MVCYVNILRLQFCMHFPTRTGALLSPLQSIIVNLISEITFGKKLKGTKLRIIYNSLYIYYIYVYPVLEMGWYMPVYHTGTYFCS